MKLRLSQSSSRRERSKRLLSQPSALESVPEGDPILLLVDCDKSPSTRGDRTTSLGMGNTPLAGMCLDGEEVRKDGCIMEVPTNTTNSELSDRGGCCGTNGAPPSPIRSGTNENGSPSRPLRSNLTSTPRQKRSLRRQSSSRVNDAVRTALQKLLKALESFWSPKLSQAPSTANITVRGGVMIYGCSTPTEHYAKVQELTERARELSGEEGLRALGLEYRMLPCPNHMPTERVEPEAIDSSMASETPLSCHTTAIEIQMDHMEEVPDECDLCELNEENGQRNDLSSMALVPSELESDHPYLCSIQPFPRSESVRSVCTEEFDIDEALEEIDTHFAHDGGPKCMLCMQRLYHKESDTLITLDNRKSFIADGDMYELVARFCQDYAMDAMCREANLEWINVDMPEDHDNSPLTSESLRVLVNADHPCIHCQRSGDGCSMSGRPSVLIATGRGKVRAGIFSREHLIGSGMEMATAMPIIREAMRRNMNVIIVDHNACGEVHGFTNFERTLDCIAWRLKGSARQGSGTSSLKAITPHHFFVVAHSASGGHLCRYLLDKQDYLPHIQAIAFTDSTHNIQWSKRQGLPELTDLLESNKCVYFRSSKAREQDESSLWYLHRSGEPIKTDEFWQHRFGMIRTFWAGTNEHSLTNWYAHSKIWQHFDECLGDELVFRSVPHVTANAKTNGS